MQRTLADGQRRPKVVPPRQTAGAIVSQPIEGTIMDDTNQLEIVDLGEAKELTKGTLMPPLTEDNPTFRFQHLG